jgi:mono/diheme cytochrome c family protein
LVCAVGFGLSLPGRFQSVEADAANLVSGKNVFEGNCSDCHNADSRESKEGPGLKGVGGGTLPSGRKASADVIRSVIEGGGAGMPPFKDMLSEKEKEDVIAYVMTL